MRRRILSAMVALLVSLSLLTACSDQRDQGAAQDIRLYQILPVARKSSMVQQPGNGEAYSLTNAGEKDHTIQGWIVQSGAGKVVLPKITLRPGQVIYLANDAQYFQKTWNFAPTFEYGEDTDKTVPDLIVLDNKPPVLNDRGDVVRLLDENGTTVDILVFGPEVNPPTPWSGAPVQFVDSPPLKPANQVFTRLTQKGKVSKGFRADAWSGGTKTDPERVYFAGQSDFPVKSVTGAMTVTAAAAPDNSGPLLYGLVEQSRRSIRIVGYQFNNMELADRLVQAAAKGVRVQVGIERNPGGADMFDSDKEAQEKLHKGGVEILYYYKWDGDLSTRFNPVHSKYAIFDDETVLVSSGNWISSAYPTDPSCGNREWTVTIKGNPDVVKLVREVWDFDFASRSSEVRPYDEVKDRPTAPDTYDAGPCVVYTPVKSQPLTVNAQKATVTRILSPDNTMDRENGFLGLLRSANQELLISANYINKWWGAAGEAKNFTEYPQPYLQEIVAAARRGVSVKVLFDRHNAQESPRDNQYVVEYLNDLAKKDGLKLEARMVCMDCTGIGRTYHNKSLVVDGATVISSINGSENSFRYARELALKIDGLPQITQYYQDLFMADWNASNRPNMVSGIRLVPRTAGTYIDWVPNLEREVTGYQVYYKSGPTQPWQVIADATRPEYEDDHLTGTWGVAAITKDGAHSTIAEMSR